MKPVTIKFTDWSGLVLINCLLFFVLSTALNDIIVTYELGFLSIVMGVFYYMAHRKEKKKVRR